MKGAWAARPRSLLAPVLFEFGGRIEFDGIRRDDLEFGTTGRTVDDLSSFQVVVQGDLRPAFDAFCHCTSVSRALPLKPFELIRMK